MEDAPLHLYYGDINKVRVTVSLKYHNVDKVDLYKFKGDNIGGSVTMKCVHNHNRSQVSNENRKKHMSIITPGCGFRLSMRRQVGAPGSSNEAWVISSVNGEHNHECNDANLQGHAQNREVPEDAKGSVNVFLNAGMTPIAIATHLAANGFRSNDNPSWKPTAEAIRRLRAAQENGKLKEGSHLDALIQLLEDEGYEYEALLDDERKLVGLCFISPDSKELVKTHLSVLMADCTYK